MYPSRVKASTRQPRGGTRSFQFLGLLVLPVLGLYLPLEAFDGDAVMGLDDVILQCSESSRPSHNVSPPTPHSPAGLPMWRILPSVTLAFAAPLPLTPKGPTDRQARIPSGVTRLRTVANCRASLVSTTTDPERVVLTSGNRLARGCDVRDKRAHR